MEKPLFSADITQKLYNEKAVLIGTFLGGPLVGAYLIGQNFKALGQPSKIGQTWLIAVASFAVAVATGFIPPLDKIPAFVFSFAFCAAAHSLTRKYQGASITAHQAEGGAMYKTGRAVWIGLIGFVLMMGLILGCFYLSDLPVAEK